MLKWNISRQVFWVTLAPLMALVVCFETFFIYDRFSNLDAELETRGALIANQLASDSEYGVFSGDVAFLHQVSDKLLRLPDVRGLVILDANAKKLLEAGRITQDIPADIQQRPGYALSEVLILPAQTGTSHTISFYKPIFPAQVVLEDSSSARAPLGALMVEFGKERVVEQKLRVLWQSAALTLLLLSAAVYLLRLASRTISRPIRELSDAVDAIGKGELDTSVDVRSNVEEIKNLAQGLRSMASELERERVGLERRVREATEALDEKLHVLSVKEEKYRTAINTSLDGFVMTDEAGNILEVNDAYIRRSGYSREELLSMSVTQLDAEQSPEQVRRTVQNILASGQGIAFASSHITKQGERWPVELSIGFARLSQPCLFAFIRDISARVASERALSESLQQIREKERAKTRFLAAASHDLRQPLAAANLFVDALGYSDLSEQQSKIIRQLQTALDSLAWLLNSLLDVSRLDAGAVKPRIETVLLGNAFEKIAVDFAPLAASKGLRLKYFAPQHWAVRTDLSILVNILHNLVANALKYANRGGVLIGVRRRGERIWVQVYDTGIGIAQENIPRIYDEFYQVDNPQRDRTKGLGLGLSIAKRQVELLGGHIRCCSVMGKGTLFEFDLPYAEGGDPITEMNRESVTDALHDLQQRRILVVEDDYLVAEGLLSLLEAMGAQVSRFGSAEDALEDEAALKADFYITDYMLPGRINGLEFLRRIAALRSGETRGLILTGDTSAQTIEKFGGLPWSVLYKPVTSQQVVQAIMDGK